MLWFWFFLISYSVNCSEGKLSSIRKQESSVKMQQLFVRACWNHHETWTVSEARLWNKIVCNEQLCLRSSASGFLNCQLLTESFFQAQAWILLIQGSEEFLKFSGSETSFFSWFLANPPDFQALIASLSLVRDWSSQFNNYQGDNTWSIFKNLGLLTMQVKPPCIPFLLLQRTESRSSRMFLFPN